MDLSQYLPLSRRSVLRTPLPGFDAIYYRYWYRDVLTDPLTHYLEVGWKEGRDPSAGFSGDGYLRANPDVMAYGVNPLLHFLEFGLIECRTGWEKDKSAPAPSPRASGPPSLRLLTGPNRQV